MTVAGGNRDLYEVLGVHREASPEEIKIPTIKLCEPSGIVSRELAWVDVEHAIPEFLQMVGENETGQAVAEAPD